MANQKYMEEIDPSGKYKICYAMKNHLYSKKSEFQQVDVVDTEYFGKMLFNDNLVMISEKDEFVYHDMMAHVPLFSHPNPKKVLVIGGGDGGTAREVLRHKNVTKCDMVEIDAYVVEACKEFIPQTAIGMKDDPRFTLMIDDGVKYMAETKEKYDVILVDSTEPIGPGAPLFGPEFYANVHRCLNDVGIVVSQAESPFFNTAMQKKLKDILSQKFPVVKFLNYTNITYPGGCWSFSVASKGMDPIKDFNPKRVTDSGLKFKYYTPELHTAAFVLPQFQKDNLGFS